MEIIFAGASHYGLGGYKSICKYFDKIYIHSDSSDEIINNKRNGDIIVKDFDSVNCTNVFCVDMQSSLLKNLCLKKHILIFMERCFLNIEVCIRRFMPL